LPVGILHAENLPGVGIDHQHDPLAGQFVGHLETHTLLRDGAVFAHLALSAVVEQLIKPGGQGAQGADPRQIPLVASERGLFLQTTMGRAVVDGFEPGPQAGVEITQITEAGGIELAQELIAKSAVPPF
jgi:hypothetical protein